MANERDDNEALRNKITRANRVVVKVSASLLSKESETFNRVVKDVYELRRAGKSVIIVSSGAIVLGAQRLGSKELPKSVPELQAISAIGQPLLMRKWQEAAQQLPVAQLLVTHQDFELRERTLVLRHMLKVLTETGVLPIFNENDAVAHEEIRSGDNDMLSAMIAGLWEAEALVILSDMDGLFDADPNLNPHAERIPLVTDLDKAKKRAAGFRGGSGLISNPMLGKLNAIEKAHTWGIPVILTTGIYAGQLSAAIRGDDVGTLFWPSSDKLFDKKEWLTNALKSKGKVWVDDSARAALIRGKRSLLPGGVKTMEGKFDVGDAVDVLGPQDDLVARGLVNYNSRELELITGKNSQQIYETLGYRLTDELVHRDDLVVLASAPVSTKKSSRSTKKK